MFLLRAKANQFSPSKQQLLLCPCIMTPVFAAIFCPSSARVQTAASLTFSLMSALRCPSDGLVPALIHLHRFQREPQHFHICDLCTSMSFLCLSATVPDRNILSQFSYYEKDTECYQFSVLIWIKQCSDTGPACSVRLLQIFKKKKKKRSPSILQSCVM